MDHAHNDVDCSPEFATRVSAGADSFADRLPPDAGLSIPERIDAWLHTLQRRDIRRLTMMYADQVSGYASSLPWDSLRMCEVRRAWELRLSQTRGLLRTEVVDLQHHESGQIGFAHFLLILSSDAQESFDTQTLRVTLGFRRQDSAWQIVLEHITDSQEFIPDQEWIVSCPDTEQ